MKINIILNKELESLLYEEYINKNQSCEKISKKLECSQSKINKLLREIKINNISLIDIKKAKLKRNMITEDFLYNQYILKDKTIANICNEFGLSTNTVGKYLKKYYINNINYIEYKQKNCVCNKISKEILYKEYYLGERTLDSLSIEFDCTPQAIQYWIKKFGIPLPFRFKEYKGFNGDISSAYWNNIKRHAKDRNLDFNISLNDAWNSFVGQNGNCAISGVKITLNKDRLIESTASLDRIDSNKGYTIDNIQWIHKNINKMKWDLSEERFFYWVKQIYEYKSNLQSNTPDLKERDLGTNQNFKISPYYWGSLKGGAKRRKIEFLIDRKYAWDIFILQNKCCAMSGIELFFYNTRLNRGNNSSASLDRIDSNNGYLEKNVQWLHKEVNIMKQDLLENEFLKWIKIIYENKQLSKV